MSNPTVDGFVQQYFGDNAPPALSDVAYTKGVAAAASAPTGGPGGGRSGTALAIAKNYIQNLSQSGDMQGYFQDASQTLANQYALVIESNNDPSVVKQDIQALVNGASSFGVDASALSNSINSTAGSNISDYNTRQANKDTGGGFGGFLNNVISVATNPVTWIAVAAAIVAPALAPAIGAELGLTGTAAAAAGYGAIGAGTGAVTAAANGGDATQIAEGALKGGVAGAAGGAIGAEAQAAAPELGATGAAAVGGATKGALTSALNGQSVGSGAAGGALGSALGTEIGGDTGKILGSAVGSATAAGLANQDVSNSVLQGAYGGLLASLGTSATPQYNPQTGQMINTVANNPMAGGDVIQGATDPNVISTQYNANQPSSVTIYDVNGNPVQSPTGDPRTEDQKLADYNAALSAGNTPEEAARMANYSPNSVNTQQVNIADTSIYPSYKAEYSGGGSTGGGSTLAPNNQTLGDITINGSKDTTLGTSSNADKTNSQTPQNKVQLNSPTIIGSTGGGTSTPLSSVLGAPSSSILGQALQSSNPDPATTGNPIFEGDDKNQKNVWNTESLRTALGLS